MRSTPYVRMPRMISFPVSRDVRIWMCILLIGFSTVNAELYTALADMEELLETEAVLLRALEEYISSTEHRLQLLRKRAADYAKEHEEASVDISSYLSNPINAYLLVKRLTSDWKQTESLMVDFTEEVKQNMTQYREVLKFPTDEDLTGAAVALMRLQDTYQLETSSVARGELNGVQYSTQLSAEDCFELGRQSYNNQDFYHTVLWMTEALQRHDKEKNATSVERWEILEYLAYSTYMQGNVRRALQMTDELLTIVPSHQRALGNKVFYQAAIEKSDNTETLEPEVVVTSRVDDLPEREIYEMLCRNGLSPPPEIMAKLKCRYVHRDLPFLKLAPLKEEEAYLKPRILLYRDVMSDKEIDVIKRMAQPRLRRATVQNYKTGELEVANYRISKSAWLKENEDEVVARISQRVEDITSLTTSTAEELQVVNYGIGGHYEPHFDFARREETNAFKSLGTGNRIATVLFYMSDVAQGGATVFPALRLSLWPEKGTAAFWYNLHSSGEGDYATRHAACPVLAGSKWGPSIYIQIYKLLQCFPAIHAICCKEDGNYEYQTNGFMKEDRNLEDLAILNMKVLRKKADICRWTFFLL
ncbi:prolyl 4-hydroxylase subunit alpha-1 isoform X3 [Lycorma delicatula]|uniref:prolyl 4-hydroxylase subunit alpha-1 isoform X3 n=1 Tax=Lycorma delicatula TaxID=130591 RepID=UPI003F50EBA0